MTRIIAGEFGGRRLVLPDDPRVRPTADRVREALMSIVASVLPGSRVLDLFAGSGALAFEALSRGAEHATLVEISPPALTAIRSNAEALGVMERVTVRRGDAVRFIRRLEANAFDVAFADPPYTLPLAAQVLDAFKLSPFARLLVVEHPADVALTGEETRRYGDIALTFCHAP